MRPAAPGCASFVRTVIAPSTTAPTKMASAAIATRDTRPAPIVRSTGEISHAHAAENTATIAAPGPSNPRAMHAIRYTIGTTMKTTTNAAIHDATVVAGCVHRYRISVAAAMKIVGHVNRKLAPGIAMPVVRARSAQTSSAPENIPASSLKRHANAYTPPAIASANAAMASAYAPLQTGLPPAELAPWARCRSSAIATAHAAA